MAGLLVSAERMTLHCRYCNVRGWMVVSDGMAWRLAGEWRGRFTYFV